MFYDKKKSCDHFSLNSNFWDLHQLAMADDGGAKAAGLWTFFGIAIACGFAIGVAALGTGMGMGNAINAALQGVARNPEASGKNNDPDDHRSCID